MEKECRASVTSGPRAIVAACGPYALKGRRYAFFCGFPFFSFIEGSHLKIERHMLFSTVLGVWWKASE